jgi:glutamine---fructose-6-phosphate transaminase (isomerizing)
MLRDHVYSLPSLVRERLPVYEAAAEAAINTALVEPTRRLHAIGCGDSFFASLAAELAFEQFGAAAFEPANAMTFSRYTMPHLRGASNAVLGVSVSGGVSRTVEGVQRARQRGVPTLAITSAATTPIGRVADRVLVTQVPDLPTAQGALVPGLRSFAASLLMLWCVAARIGELAGRDASALCNGLRELPDHLTVALARADGWASDLATQTIPDGHYIFVGSGPAQAIAQFGAAKMLEAAGDHAQAVDVEEWAHLQYFSKRRDTPTIVLGSEVGADRGRRDEVLTAMRATGVEPAIWLASADVPEWLSPMVLALPVALLAAHRASLIGEPSFRNFGGGRSIEGGGGISRIRTSEIELLDSNG